MPRRSEDDYSYSDDEDSTSQAVTSSPSSPQFSPVSDLMRDYERTLASCVEHLNELASAAPRRRRPEGGEGRGREGIERDRGASSRDLAASVLLAGLLDAREPRAFRALFSELLDDVDLSNYREVVRRGASVFGYIDEAIEEGRSAFAGFLARTLDLTHRLILRTSLQSRFDVFGGLRASEAWASLAAVRIVSVVSDSTEWIVYFHLAEFEHHVDAEVLRRVSKNMTASGVDNLHDYVRAVRDGLLRREEWSWADFDEETIGEERREAPPSWRREKPYDPSKRAEVWRHVRDAAERETRLLHLLKGCRHPLADVAGYYEELLELSEGGDWGWGLYDAPSYTQRLEQAVTQYPYATSLASRAVASYRRRRSDGGAERFDGFADAVGWEEASREKRSRAA